MKPLDYIIFFTYLALTLMLGVFFARKQKHTGDFFLAGRSMHWFPIGLSVMTTSFSAINYTAFSGEVFRQGLYVLLCLPIFAAVAIPVVKVIMPFYHRLGICSAYEYLERRFDYRVRCLASALFILWRIFWMAVVLVVLGRVISAITGIDELLLISAAGVVAMAYAATGGMKAIMWTDVLQFFVLIGGIILAVAVGIHRTPGGIAEIIHTCAINDILKPFYPFDPTIFSFDPSIRITLWSAWIGTFIAFLARYGTDQTIVQRYFTARSLRHAQKGFHLSYISSIVAMLSLALMGFVVFTFAQSSGFLDTADEQPVFYFSIFVKSLPSGASGLIIAGLFAAAMSSVDSGIKSCCTAFFADFYDRFGRNGKIAEVTLSRLLTLTLGLLAISLAYGVGHLGSIFEITNKIINGFGSPLLALFLLGMFSRSANSAGVFAGGLMGACLSIYISFSVDNLALHYYAVINLIGTLFFCYIFSAFENLSFGNPSDEQLSWVWVGRKQKEIYDHTGLVADRI